MKKVFLLIILIHSWFYSFCWGFFAHKKINYYAVFLLPPELLSFYKLHIQFITAHAVDPDKRRNVMTGEGARHYIDIDHYGAYPYTNLPRKWEDAECRFTIDTLETYGILPWNILSMLSRLTKSFREKDVSKILKNSAELGHYIADAHVPLHTNSNHNGQRTHQEGIHAFWESRIPELLADKQFNFFIGKAEYIQNPAEFIWARILESGNAADSVLCIENELSGNFSPDKKYAFEQRNKLMIKQYSPAYTIEYNKQLKGMVERRMRQSIYAIACFWYTAWVNAGQPDLNALRKDKPDVKDSVEFEELDKAWKAGKAKEREHE